MSNPVKETKKEMKIEWEYELKPKKSSLKKKLKRLDECVEKERAGVMKAIQKINKKERTKKHGKEKREKEST